MFVFRENVHTRLLIVIHICGITQERLKEILKCGLNMFLPISVRVLSKGLPLVGQTAKRAPNFYSITFAAKTEMSHLSLTHFVPTFKAASLKTCV